MWILTMATGVASPPREEVDDPHEIAVMMSPLGTVVSVVATASGMPTLDVTPRVHHALSQGLGWTAQLDLTSALAFDMHVSYTGVRGGPRLALRRRGLADWTLMPFLLVGVASLTALDVRLARYGLVGVGVEAGRTWVWRRLAVELGLGVYTARSVGYTTRAEVVEDLRPRSVSPVKPTFTASVGYAF